MEDVIIRYAVILFMVVMFIGFSIVSLQKRRHDKERIRDYLLAKGYRNVAIHYEWLDFDKSNSTYRIECMSPAGVSVITGCKIHRWEGYDDDIFWKTPL